MFFFHRPLSTAERSALAATLECYLHPELSVFPTRSRLWLIKWASRSPPVYSHLLPLHCFRITCLSLSVCTPVICSPYAHTLLLDDAVAPIQPSYLHEDRVPPLISFFLLLSIAASLEPLVNDAWSAHSRRAIISEVAQVNRSDRWWRERGMEGVTEDSKSHVSTLRRFPISSQN